MKVWMGKGEWYPVFSIELDQNPVGWEVDVAPRLLRRYNAALVEWIAVQDLLQEIAKATDKESSR